MSKVLIIFLLGLSVSASGDGKRVETITEKGGVSRLKSLIWKRKGFKFLSQIDEIDSSDSKLQSASTSLTPWSGDYWRLTRGGVAFRYADPYFVELLQKNNDKKGTEGRFFPKYVNHLKTGKRKFAKYVNQGYQNLLSPTEKYDLLVGDFDQKLTQATLASARYNFTKGKGALKHFKRRRTPGWTGYCDGWSVSSIIEPRPLRAITVRGYQGHQITFYPDDLKALLALFWSSHEFDHKFISEQCRDKKGKKYSCNSINPRDWHLLVVNQLGQSRFPLIFDNSAGGETWNHPLHSYRFRYVDTTQDLHFENTRWNKKHFSFLQKNSSVLKTNFKDAIIPIERDPYRSRRSKGTKYVLRVAMKIWYRTETDGKKSFSDSILNDLVDSRVLIYDLELNEKRKVVGGNWIGSIIDNEFSPHSHPDFVWMPKSSIMKKKEKGQLTLLEKMMDLKWEGGVTDAAHKAATQGFETKRNVGDQIIIETYKPSSELGIPLYHILKGLLEEAAQVE